MPNIFFNPARKGRRRRDGTPDGKSVALTEAGIRLFARKDYDAISMARIAREAGCSVGALYGRYSDKDAYLYHVIAQAFRSLRDNAKRTLESGRWQLEAPSFVVKQIVGHVVGQMTQPHAAGIIRATIKLAAVKPLAMDLFENYRSDVTDLAVNLLGKRGRISSGTIRIGMQMVLGTATDAVLQKHPGPMNAGSPRMIAALTNVLLGYFGLADSDSWAGDEAEGEDDPADVPDLGSETPPDLAEGETAIFDPVNRTYHGKSPAPTKKRRKSREKIDAAKSISRARQSLPIGQEERAPTKKAKARPPEPSLKTSRKAKHRWI